MHKNKPNRQLPQHATHSHTMHHSQSRASHHAFSVQQSRSRLLTPHVHGLAQDSHRRSNHGALRKGRQHQHLQQHRRSQTNRRQHRQPPHMRSDKKPRLLLTLPFHHPVSHLEGPPLLLVLVPPLLLLLLPRGVAAKGDVLMTMTTMTTMKKSTRRTLHHTTHGPPEPPVVTPVRWRLVQKGALSLRQHQLSSRPC